MSDQLLDNPAYHAMISGNANLSLGTPTVGYIPAAVSPDDIVIPVGWKINFHGLGLQMMGEHAMGPSPANWEFVALRKEHVPLMVDLAKLTNPGPFAERTIEFGSFVGCGPGTWELHFNMIRLI